ncbi:hypothetical protein B7463_g9552, partial [Scytalidium lignicola]
MPSLVKKSQTLYDKVFESHIVDEHLVYEVSSPQAFEGLCNAGRKVRRPDCTLVTIDYVCLQANSRMQCLTLEDNVKDFGIMYFGLGDKRQGIVHIIGPEQGFTLPGTTLVCGDSHTSTHGAFGALAFGIGASEVEHVLVTQTLITRRSQNMKIQVDGIFLPGVTSKDIILHIIGIIGIAGGKGAVIEFCGSIIRNLSMEARMSICNMSIEAGARAGMIAPDQKTFDYLKGRPLAPKIDSPEWNKSISYWKSLKLDEDAKYDREIYIDTKDIVPIVSWGTTAQDVVLITGIVLNPDDFSTSAKRESGWRALHYMDLELGTWIEDIELDKIFIGLCTNSRIEDLRVAANIVQGKKVAVNVKRAIVVPGSGLIKRQAEKEGLDQIFKDAGFEWREPGCSMCLCMSLDILSPRERCASTSNRNFEGCQGVGGRTHLMSPIMAAAAAIVGKLTDVRKLLDGNITPFEAIMESDLDKGNTIDDSLNTPKDSNLNVNNTPSEISAGLPKFTKVRGVAAPMDQSNIDTDAIIPKQFLKTIKRTGLGSALFHTLRFNVDGSEIPEFVLNKEPYRYAKILVITGLNFGCGSSREHASWAILDFGITCIIAPSYADIFFNNTFKNGMLLVIITDPEKLAAIADEARAGKEIEVDLVNQCVNDASGNQLATFEVEDFRKHCLLNGLDDIGLTMQIEDKITRFEERRTIESPWLDRNGYLRKGVEGRAVKLSAVPIPDTIGGIDGSKPLEW